VKIYPVDYIKENIKYSDLKKINNYANKVIKSLKEIPITSSSQEIKKSHLVEMAKTSGLVGRAIMRRLSALKAEKNLLDDIYDTLNCTFEAPSLPKKDDDSGVEEAQSWVKNSLKAYPVGHIREKVSSAAKFCEINELANEIIKSLNGVTITSSNVGIIKSRFAGIAEESDLVRQALVKKVSKLKAEESTRKSLIDDIHNTLVCTFQKD
jgi:hypothetical protein